MGKWLRIDATLDANPKILPIGFFPTALLLMIWRIAKLFDTNGVITKYWNVEYLMQYARLEDFCCPHCTRELSEHLISSAMAEIFSAGLVEQVDDDYVIHDWAEYQRDISTDRVKKYRQNRRLAESQDEKRSNVSGNGVKRSETLSVTETKMRLMTGQQQDNNRTTTKKNASHRSDINSFSAYPAVVVAIATRWMQQLPYYQDEQRVTDHTPAWCQAIEKLHRIDGHDWSEIQRVVAWICADRKQRGTWRGWFSVIQSPMKLRKKNKDNIPYYNVILNHMANDPLNRTMPSATDDWGTDNE